EAVPAVGRVADAKRLKRISDRTGRACPFESGLHLHREAAPLELGARVTRERMAAQGMLEERRSELVDGVKFLFATPSRGRFAALRVRERLLYLDPSAVREQPDGLGERLPLELHHEVD